jgi:endonuclease/exonuclease/phosphatase family metal-dependent hydrolase
VKYFNFVVAVVLTILYGIGKIPPSEKYNLWVVTFIIPFALALNFILLVVSLALRKRSSLYYIITLIIGSNYLLSTFGVKTLLNKTEFTDNSFRVLNYNVNASNNQTIDGWIADQEAEIQCYQEFVNRDMGQGFDIVTLFQEKGYQAYFSYDSTKAYRSAVVGTLIASKFPIINAGDVVASENGFNRITFADLHVEDDTLRVINVHLESMGLKRYSPLRFSGYESKTENAKIIIDKLKEGVFERSRQIKILTNFIEASPHPVICAGDFNDMPYSYSYQFMKRHMKNAFEEVGTGLGFTYNGNTLRVLRIDNQFYTSGVDAERFETLAQVKYTDHYPLRGSYTLNR